LVKHRRAYPSAFLNKCVKERNTNLVNKNELENVICEIIKRFYFRIFIFNSLAMKHILFSFLLLNVYCKAQTNKQIDIILSHIQSQQIAWNEGNINGFMKYYWQNDSLKFIGSNGIIYGWQNTLEKYKKSYPTKEAMGKLQFTILEKTQISENYVYIIGKWEVKKEKPASGYFTLLWRKIKNEWVIIADHTS
jgi:ketosteroid isomerase-like protein